MNLVDSLTEQQVHDELSRIYSKDYINIRNNPRKQKFSLKQHYVSVLMTDGDTTTKRLDELPAHFSRHVEDANTQLEFLKKSIDSAQKLIDEVQASTVTSSKKPEDPTTLSSETIVSSQTPDSDNEPSIDPNSSISTITLGEPRPVLFTVQEEATG
ncbi:hypothetical protein ACHWQZ_G004957 [Mnemiopsis leidyi]